MDGGGGDQLGRVVFDSVCQRRGRFVIRRYDLHLFPVVGEFLAAIEADNVCARCQRGTRTTLARSSCNGKAKSFVPATEENIRKFRQHTYPHRYRRTLYSTEARSQLQRIRFGNSGFGFAEEESAASDGSTNT
jgi:hypothetical protein